MSNFSDTNEINYERRRVPTARRRSSGSARARKRKTNLAIFYAVTMVIGVAVCVTLFIVAFQTIVQPNTTVSMPQPTPTEDPNAAFVRPEHDQALAMVTALNTFVPQTIDVHFLETGRSERFSLTDTTTVRNRFGSPIGFGEINLGQIVDVTFDVNTNEVANISVSGRAWEEQLTGFTIDLDAATITVGNQVYSYSSRTLILNRNEPFSIAHVNSADLITLVGFQDKIWSLRVDSGNGFIRFENYDRIVGGTVAIGNSIFRPLDDSGPVAVFEGTHRVIIDGQNIDTFPADVVVTQGTTITVDLASVIFRLGSLQVVVTNEPEATILINGEPAVIENTLIELEYGTHILRVEHPGFIPIQEEIMIVQPFTRMELELVPDQPQDALILIESFPTTAQIFVNDAFVGNSPLTVNMPFGTNVIVARMLGHEERVIPIVVDEHSARQFLLHLNQLSPVMPAVPTLPPPIATSPGGELPGTTPVLPPLPPGTTPVPLPTLPPETAPPGTAVEPPPLPTPPPGTAVEPPPLPPLPTPPPGTAVEPPPPTEPDAIWPPPDYNLPLPDENAGYTTE
ncbi:MAG: PEGA domain-containing protein [Defluviitaleaceae bacterium]|nr:PEGA domain-containing protein [Defluviitaleaceae bacterium]